LYLCKNDFKRQSQAFRRKLMRPVATNVRILFDGVETYDAMPGELPDLFYGAPLRMIGRYKQGGPTRVTVSGEVMGRPFEQTVEIPLPKSNDENPEIERMWAYCRVQQLMNELRENGNNADKEKEIVRLCEGYSIVSEYASFIVLENDAEYQRWSIQRRNATRVGRDDTARRRLQVELERLREQSLAAIGPNKTESSSKSTQATSQGTDPGASQNVASSTPSDLNLPVTNSIAPVSVDSGSRNVGVPIPSSTPSASSGRSFGRSGGAIDPVTAAIALSLAGASAWAARRRNVAMAKNSGTST
jgi:Ca-activated chloride channel family protein